jgi:leucyl-tRNA synthetase
MQYDPKELDRKWQAEWAKQKPFAAKDNSEKPKYYVLDMFPYPSGAGLHVGHPLGYIASDIVSRYKRLKGFNVLHPMGYDSFGLPAEQYAIQTGQHPAKTTEENIATYRRQMDSIGFSFDWDREVRTSDPSYYKWTQWTFLKLYDAWYCKNADAARPIERLVKEFEQHGNGKVNAHCDETPVFTADEWNSWDGAKQQTILLNYRIAYLSEAYVNWCPALGTVLANDEVKDGFSERGGHPVERKLMMQWSMRITAYAQRLLDGLDGLEWSESLKEQQRNWIGRSEGASIKFEIRNQKAETGSTELSIEVFTTRPDTIFGVSFMVLAPEHELVSQITTAEQKAEVEAYIAKAKARSDRDRMADVKTVSGAFTGAYAEHPFTGAPIPIWIGDYVLAGYGTGAVMAVPSGDQRDWNFAKHFNLPIPSVIAGSELDKGANESKEGVLENSDFLNGLPVKEAIKRAIAKLEEKGIGKGRINYRLRDAVFGRQRYWGEPIPIFYKDGIPYPVKEEHLPVTLPEIDEYLPTETGEPPLGRAKGWGYDPERGAVFGSETPPAFGHPPLSGGELAQTATISPPGKEGSGEVGIYPFELSTMPGWAGSSWYFLRYMDPHNPDAFASKEAIDYWQNVDLYVGGSEHATGHLLYVRFWTKFLKDLGYLPFDEPAKKLVNQGMIQGVSQKIYFSKLKVSNIFIEPLNDDVPFNEPLTKILSADEYDRIAKLYSSQNDEAGLKRFVDQYTEKNVPIQFDSGSFYKIDELLNSDIGKDYYGSVFVSGSTATHFTSKGDITPLRDFPQEDFTTRPEVEKMSKSKWNVVNPDDIIGKYGADTLRLYEMFLGPLEDAKPWNTNGIEGTYRFLRKFWNLFHAGDAFAVSDDAPTKAELKALHATIRKVEEDIEKLSLNTSVSQFMICVNELTELKCNKRAILEPLTIVLSSFAPHICEELWEKLGHAESITFASYPRFEAAHLVEDSFNYPISFNGKTKLQLELSTSLSAAEVEAIVVAHPEVIKRLEGATPKKVIVVPKRIVNVVV